MCKKVDEDRFQHTVVWIEEVLQEIEDELIQQGLVEYIVPTEHGSFTWRSIEPTRERAER